MMGDRFDIAIVGAGMAGASLAAELAPHARVLLLEAEDAPGYHATGRSAAFWEECYGGPAIVPLTLASGPWLRDHGFLHRRGALYIGRDADAPALDAFIARFGESGARIERLDRAALAARLPGVRPAWTGAVWEPACADIDVAGLHQHRLAAAKAGGAVLVCRARLTAARRDGDGWQLRTDSGAAFAATTLVNAAGAWADPVAAMAGVRPLGIRPLRRTVAQVRVNTAVPADLPLVLDIGGRFYFKPEGGGGGPGDRSGRLWLSPHDETPCEPGDAAPEDLAVAEAVARFETVVAGQVTAVERRWAGLRSFAPDRRPVYGFDARAAGFFWFAGQGGFGIQTAPAAARLAAQILLGQGRDAMTEGLDLDLYAPARFG